MTQISVGDIRARAKHRHRWSRELASPIGRSVAAVSPFAAALGLTLFCALRTRPVPLPVNENLQHMAAFAALMLSGAVTARRPLHFIGLAAGLILLGGFIELLQMLPFVHRDADVVDWMADVAGVGLGCLGPVALARYRRRVPGSDGLEARPGP
jgi:hypothetical protein